MEPTPRLLETYEEARLLLEAKGWAMTKAAEHLSELPEMAPFHISQTKLSRKTVPGEDNPIEPEVAAAVEAMPTWSGYERKTEIVTRGLLALHGDPPSEEVERLAAELRERLAASEHALKLVEALEEKAGQRLTSLGQKLAEKSASELTPKLVEAVEAIDEKANQRAVRFSQQIAEGLRRASRKQVAISAGSVALVALLLVPLLSAAHAFSTGPRAVIVPAIAMDDSPVLLRFDPGSLFPTPARWGEKPLDQAVPKSTLPGQAVAPCNAEAGEVAINGNCWANMGDLKPPCGRLAFRQGDKCYRPVAADPKKPVGPAP